MPTYIYICKSSNCDEETELTRKVSDRDNSVQCQCGAAMKRTLRHIAQTGINWNGDYDYFVGRHGRGYVDNTKKEDAIDKSGEEA